MHLPLAVCSSLLACTQKATEVAGVLTSTLLKHHVALKLELILDKETKITHESFALQIEGRLGDEQKGPDMRIWDKAKNARNVRILRYIWEA